jgi:hypothetical protein
MVEDIIVKCGRKRVSTMMIVITKASMNMERERIRRQEERMAYYLLLTTSLLLVYLCNFVLSILFTTCFTTSSSLSPSFSILTPSLIPPRHPPYLLVFPLSYFNRVFLVYTYIQNVHVYGGRHNS